MSRPLSCFRLFLAPILAGTLASASALADDTTTATNPASGQTESVWSGSSQGNPREIRFSTHSDTGWSTAEQLTSDSADDFEPCLAFTPNGDRRVFWWKDGSPDAIYYSEKPYSGGSWSTPIVVSSSSDDARAPRAAIWSGTLFVAWEALPANGNRKIVVQKQETPNPWPDLFTWTASQTSPLGVQFHLSGSHFWIDWVDSSTVVRWSEYVNGSWGSAQSESYSGANDLDAARLRVKSIVLGQ